MFSVWKAKVTPDGTIETSVGGRPPVVGVLAPKQRERLRSLVAALPKEKTGYGFGPSPDLEPTIFQIAVTVGKDERRYLVRNPPSADFSRAELEPVLELLHFLYGLVGSKDALEPPRLENRTPGR